MIGAAGRMALVVAGLLLLLTYMLFRGTAPDIALYERRLDALDSVIFSQAALHRDVLRARAGLLRNYDPLVLAVDGLREAVETLQGLRRANAEAVRRFRELTEEIRAQESLVEDFKSSNALLQNSLAYFAYMSPRLEVLARRVNPAAAPTVGALANAMLRFTRDPSSDAGAEVAASLDRFADLPLSGALREDGPVLVAHGRLILVTLPAVDDVLARLLAARTAERAQALQTLILGDYRRAETRAKIFRVLLYLAAVSLLAYLGYLYLRLRANARVLADRSRALQARSDFEHLIAGISAQFIDLPRDQIGAGLRQGLERLGRHVGVDRAYVVFSADDDPGAESIYGWDREGVTPSERWPIAVSAIASGQRLKRYERHGCIDLPSVAALPPGAERTVLEAAGVRSWICVPLWHAGRRIGLLALDGVRGEKRWADDDIALLRTAGEIFANALERERAEREKEALETRLRQARRMEAIGTLAGGIAHDFNNILGAILGYAEMALGTLPKGSRAWRHVQEVRKAGERGRGVVDRILTFSRRVEHRRRPTRMQPVIEEAIGLLRASLPAAIEIRAHIGVEDAVVLGDATQLQQVVMNLVTNAAQAMTGHGVVEIVLDGAAFAGDQVLSHGTLTAGRYVRLAVSDTGHGMDEATMERIFEPFFTTKAAGAGTGLGLATVHGIVADHDGALNVRSRPGAGSTFEAFFRCAEAAEAEDRPAEAPLPRGRGETILLVDDETPLVLLGEEMLAALGYEPVGFDSSARALSAFRADPQRFDLLIVDEVMPEMNGTQLAAAVHRIRPDLPMILMTGYGGQLEAQRLRAVGIREVLKKPLLSADIANGLARHLHSGDGSAAASSID